MKRPPFTSLEDIKLELHVLSLQRKIYLEELKMTKHQFKEDLRPINWLATLLKGVKKYGALMLLKKIIK